MAARKHPGKPKTRSGRSGTDPFPRVSAEPNSTAFQRSLRHSNLHIRLYTQYMEEILDLLGRGVTEAADAIERATDVSGEYGQLVADDKCGLIEDILGTAFVVCQRYVKEIEAAAMPILNAQFPGGHAWKKGGLLRLGKRVPVGGGRLTQVQLIDAAANFFKHGGSWDAPWDELEGTPKRHARLLKAVGTQENCTGQFRQIARALGNAEFTDMHVFGDAVNGWGNAVEGLARKYR